MKRISYFLIATAVLALSACSVNKEQDQVDEFAGKEMTFTGVVVDEGTKTAVQPGSAVWWTPGDAIWIFHGSSVGAKFTADIDSPSATAEFTGVLNEEESAEEEYYWALYPSSAARYCDGSSIMADLSAQQTAQAGSFAPNTNITVARSKTAELSFYNACSGMWFTVTQEGIKSVTFQGNANEDVAGSFWLTMEEGDTPVPSTPIVYSGKKSVTLSAPAGETLKVGEKYFIVILPQTFMQGVTLTFEKATEEGFRIYPQSLTFERSLFKHSEDADKNVVFVPKTSGGSSYIEVEPGGGTITLPADVDEEGIVLLDFTKVTDQSDYSIAYDTQDGAKKPGIIYMLGGVGSSVGMLSGDLASSTVHLLSGKYSGTSLTTALSTLVIELGVQVGTVTVNGGSVMVNGTVTSLNVSEDAATGDDDEEQIVIVINNTVSVVSVEETNCSIQVTSDGQVTVMDTQAKETSVQGTVGDLTAGESAGSVSVQEGGEVTGTLDTKAQETSVTGKVADLTAGESAGSVKVQEGGEVTGTLDTKAQETSVTGKVADLTAGESAGSVSVHEGGEITGTLDTKAKETSVQGTVKDLTASEGAGHVNVKEGGEVTGTLDTKAKETSVTGKVADLTAGEGAGSVRVQEGGEVTGTLETKAQETSVQGTVNDLNASEGAGSVTVHEGGEVTGTLDTKAQETSVNGTVKDLTAGEGAGTVKVQEGGEVTGTLDTKAETTTIEGGATVNDVAASGEGSLTVEGGATVDSVSATGDVSVAIDDNVQTSSGGVPAYLVVVFDKDILAIPIEGMAAITVTVTSNVAWAFSFPESVYWLQAEGTLSGPGAEQSFTLKVDASPSVLARKTPLTFSYGEDKEVVYALIQAGSDGFTATIEDWGDGENGEFEKE